MGRGLFAVVFSFDCGLGFVLFYFVLRVLPSFSQKHKYEPAMKCH